MIFSVVSVFLKKNCVTPAPWGIDTDVYIPKSVSLDQTTSRTLG